MGLTVKNLSRNKDLVTGGLVLIVGLNNYLTVSLITDYHVLITNEITQNLVERLVLHSKVGRFVDVPQRYLLQGNLGICSLGHHFKHFAQWLVADPQCDRLLFPARRILGICRCHATQQRNKNEYLAEKPEIKNSFSHNLFDYTVLRLLHEHVYYALVEWIAVVLLNIILV